MSRLFGRHSSAFLELALMVFAVGLVESCSAQEPPGKVAVPPPGPEERKLSVLIGKWQNPFQGKKQDPSAPEQTDGMWEGKWILDGHLLTLTATNLAPGKLQKELDVFGYSSRAKRHYMIVITAGGQSTDKVEVSWFTIDGNAWRFAPREEKVGDKIVRHRTTWGFESPDLTTTLEESSEDGVHWFKSGQGEHRRMDGGLTSGVDKTRPARQATTRADKPQKEWKLPPPGPEMAILSAWVGTWPNKHQEKGFYVDGSFDSKPIADGYFLGFFETNVFVFDSGKKESQKEVDVWGYSDTASLYFRVDAVTYHKDSVQAPEAEFSAWWFGKGNALILAAPLPETKVGDKVVPTRYGLMLESPDVMTVFEEDLEDGVHWSAPKVLLKRTRTDH